MLEKRFVHYFELGEGLILYPLNSLLANGNWILIISMSWCAWERDYVAHVAYSSYIAY